MPGVPFGLELSLPDWVPDLLSEYPVPPADEPRMRLAIRLARENVERGEQGGGPFASLVFRDDTGELIGVGLNSVRRLRNSVLHAEVMAIMLAERATGRHAFGVDGAPAATLITTCEPCVMCLGAVLWSGIGRLVCGAAKADAQAIGFDEGPVTDESYRYLEARGVEIRRGILRDEAARVLALYRDRGRPMY